MPDQSKPLKPFQSYEQQLQILRDRKMIIEGVVSLYEFDRKLRNHFFAAIDTIEVALRSRMGYALGQLDEQAHMDAVNFRPGINYVRSLRTILGRFMRASDANDPVARHHRVTYGA